MPQVKQIVEALGTLAPWDLAESWDRVGLQVGSADADATRVMVALDLNPEVIQEGIEHGVDGFVLHHPLIFKPLTRVDPGAPVGRCLELLIKQGLFLIAAHTNMDKAENGLNQYLAEQFGLTQIEPLEPVMEQLYKVVVFTPEDHLAAVRTAMAEAGAGTIGAYTGCSFGLKGIGTFKPGSQARPFTGRPGEFTEVSEIRLEMVAGPRHLPGVLKAITENHPYETPAVDVYPLAGSGRQGLGRVGNLKTALTFDDFVAMVQKKLAVKGIRVSGRPGKLIRRLAICSGSGGNMVSAAAENRADAYLTGEMGYHDFLYAKEKGLAVIAAGHWATERGFIPMICGFLNGVFKTEESFEAVPCSTIQEEPYLTL